MCLFYKKNCYNQIKNRSKQKKLQKFDKDGSVVKLICTKRIPKNTGLF